MLLSYLLKCGCCGGGFSKVSQSHYGCSTAQRIAGSDCVIASRDKSIRLR
jgi:hypothetical protein